MSRATTSELVGQRFGKWTILTETRAVFGGRLRGFYECRCDCGTIRQMAGDALKGGKSTQCRNCGNRVKAALKSRLTHGLSNTRLHRIWSQMKRRCEKPNCPDFPRYGERGISVCSAWQQFQAFHDWALSNGYEAHLTIERRDNEKGYEPSNCIWATRVEQNRNRRNNQRFDWRGQRLMLSEIAEIEGIPHDLLRQRVRRDGLTIGDAVALQCHQERTENVSSIRF